MVVFVWIVAAWLLGLAVFVALRAYGTRRPETSDSPAESRDRPGTLPSQRTATDWPTRSFKRG